MYHKNRSSWIKTEGYLQNTLTMIEDNPMVDDFQRFRIVHPISIPLKLQLDKSDLLILSIFGYLYDLLTPLLGVPENMLPDRNSQRKRERVTCPRLSEFQYMSCHRFLHYHYGQSGLKW